MNRPKPKPPTAPKRQRAAKRPFRVPEPMDASPEEIVGAAMFGPPKREWDYLKKRQREK
ncbi:MAG: hypothetical protein OXF27_06330 [Acidobacteria bacterium]|nr:hypothetical protein [Acidobacteriota bacterium]